MSDFTDCSSRCHCSETAERLRAWLLSRSAESWLFFAAGIIVGVIVG